MTLRIAGPLILAAACSAWSARGADAQSIGYLVPDRFELSPGSEISVQLARGKAGVLASAPWPSREVDWFLVRAAGGQRNVENPSPARDGETSVRIALADPDVTLIGIDRRPWIESVPGAELREFLGRDLEPSALPAGWQAHAAADTIRVRHVESAKLLVRVAGRKDDLHGSATAFSKTGQRTEIRPMIDPTSMAVGGDLPLRVSWAGGADAETRIVARQVAAGVVQTATTSKEAGRFLVTAPGRWQVEVHRARWLAGDPAADWELETATLCFVVPEPGKPEGGGK